MGFECGIVGLPNVGKSTLFNALTRTSSAHAANYPFATIEPNTGDVPVPDERLEKIAAIASSARIIPTRLTFVDIAGLVKGASKGEGLGNQFLANIRETDAIAHVLRCFEDGDITHVDGRTDPVEDARTVETELMIADMESLGKRIAPLIKKANSGEKDAKEQVRLMQAALEVLQDGKPARVLEVSKEDLEAFRMLQLLTAKPVLYVCNVGEDEAATGNDHSRAVETMAAEQDATAITISAAIEAEIALLEDEERDVFLDDLGLEAPSLDRMIRAGYDLLGLLTYFTAGPKETRAWTVTSGTKAPAAAGAIHTDFEKGFIRAQTIAYDDYVGLGGEVGAKDAGKVRDEGKGYVVQDGDVMLFRFNV